MKLVIPVWREAIDICVDVNDLAIVAGRQCGNWFRAGVEDNTCFGRKLNLASH